MNKISTLYPHFFIKEETIEDLIAEGLRNEKIPSMLGGIQEPPVKHVTYEDTNNMVTISSLDDFVTQAVSQEQVVDHAFVTEECERNKKLVVAHRKRGRRTEKPYDNMYFVFAME
jgi:hypothetical protein